MCQISRKKALRNSSMGHCLVCSFGQHWNQTRSGTEGGHADGRAAKLSLLNFLSLFRDLQKPTRFSGGGGWL